MTPSRRAPTTSLVAIFAAACGVLILQIAITRILSATVGHHMAFAVIALVMLGLAASATTVFVQRNRPDRPAGLSAATNALHAAAGSSLATVVLYVLASSFSWGALFPVKVAITGGLFFAIFWFAGYAVAFLLAEHARDTSRLYWFDLMGAALGCLAVVPLIDSMSPLVVVLWCALLFDVAALALTLDPADGRRSAGTGHLVGGVIVALLATAMPGLTRLGFAKEEDQSDVLWETWNRLSRVTVSTDIPGYEHNVRLLQEKQPDVDAREVVDRWRIGWGMSPRFKGDVPDIRWIMLDTDAGTQILEQGATRYAELDFLEHDITGAAYHLRRDALDRVFVIGGGGGRDPLTALHFGADHVDVAELNPDVVRAVNERFGDFSGRVYSLPQLEVTIGEARSTLSRMDRTYDLIQMSMIDTWASSVAGALVLSENALYTKDAFELYVDHLSDDGLLTVSRWAGDRMWGELARTLALMGSALRSHGIEDPGAHMAVLQVGGHSGPGVATCILKRSPFTQAEIEQLTELARRMRFRLLWPEVPNAGTASFDVGGVLAEDPEVLASVPYDLSPPTDDRPFFFNVRPIFSSWFTALRAGDASLGSPSTVITGALLLILLLVGRILAIAPLEAHNKQLPEAERTHLADHTPPLLYFAGLGLGFILVEVGILQRYLTFLGHPTYAMSVVLFSLLLSSGFGSSLSGRFATSRKVVIPFSLLFVGVAITAFAVPSLLHAVHGWDLSLRIVLATVLVAPLGLCMGMLYPLGVRRLVEDEQEHLVPWVWSINGLLGVFGSVFGMMIAMAFGYTAVLMLGAAAYGVSQVSTTRSWRPGAGGASAK